MNRQDAIHGPRIRDTAEKIATFKILHPGWHYGGGVPPSPKSIETALELNRAFEQAGFTKTNAFPGIDGELRVTGYHGSTYLELTIERDGLITFVHHEGDDEIAYYEAVSFNDALTRVRSFWGRIWVTFGLSIGAGTIPISSGSKPWPLDRLAMVEFPSLTRTASYKLAQVSVNILRGTTETVQEPLRSSGTYSAIAFLKSASSSSKPAQLETNVTAT